jgi:ATP-binding protein involved in chromosome partitioning
MKGADMTDLNTIKQTLQGVMDPELKRSIVDLGMVHDIAFEHGVVTFTLALTTMGCPLRNQMSADAREHLMALEGVRDVVINMREMSADERLLSLANKPRAKKARQRK